MEKEKQKTATQEKKKVALISVFAAIILTGFKLIIGLLTGSLGILSEALHSGLDLVAAVITYFSVRVSDVPADKNSFTFSINLGSFLTEFCSDLEINNPDA